VQVVVAMVGDPLVRRALEGRHAADGCEILEPLRRLERLVSELAVVRVRDPHAGRAVEQKLHPEHPPREEARHQECEEAYAVHGRKPYGAANVGLRPRAAADTSHERAVHV